MRGTLRTSSRLSILRRVVREDYSEAQFNVYQSDREDLYVLVTARGINREFTRCYIFATIHFYTSSVILKGCIVMVKGASPANGLILREMVLKRAMS